MEDPKDQQLAFEKVSDMKDPALFKVLYRLYDIFGVNKPVAHGLKNLANNSPTSAGTSSWRK